MQFYIDEAIDCLFKLVHACNGERSNPAQAYRGASGEVLRRSRGCNGERSNSRRPFLVVAPPAIHKQGAPLSAGKSVSAVSVAVHDVLPDRNVMLEVDEGQHKTRACECEQIRMINITQALGSETTIWIRYNPDAFKGGSCSRAKRHAILKSWLLWAFKEPRENLPTATVVQLFFDGFTEGGVRPWELLPAKQ